MVLRRIERLRKQIAPENKQLNKLMDELIVDEEEIKYIQHIWDIIAEEKVDPTICWAVINEVHRNTYLSMLGIVTMINKLGLVVFCTRCDVIIESAKRGTPVGAIISEILIKTDTHESN